MRSTKTICLCWFQRSTRFQTRRFLLRDWGSQTQIWRLSMYESRGFALVRIQHFTLLTTMLRHASSYLLSTDCYLGRSLRKAALRKGMHCQRQIGSQRSDESWVLVLELRSGLFLE